jgi:hypothetical protein
MPRLEDSLTAEAKRLAAQATEILRKVRNLQSELEGEELGDVASWATRLGQLVRKLYGDRSEQYATYSKAVATDYFYSLHSNSNAHIAILLGLAKSLVHDLEHGLLFEIRSLVQAEVFSDFLEMGEYLLQEGYKDAAAVVIGAVLEDGLRKLAQKNGMSVTNPSGRALTIDPLNAALAASTAYSKLVQKQVTTWAHVRNKAAHGEYGEYTKEQVEMMLLFVQGFCAEHLK